MLVEDVRGRRVVNSAREFLSVWGAAEFGGKDEDEEAAKEPLSHPSALDLAN
jgi:hypothetical protein